MGVKREGSLSYHREIRIMATVHSVAKQIVHDAIDMDYVKDCGFEYVHSVYNSEVGNHKGFSSKACHDYLQGLPGVCEVPFMNYKILEILESNGITRNTDDGQHALIEKYWAACGYHFHQLITREMLHCVPFKK